MLGLSLAVEPKMSELKKAVGRFQRGTLGDAIHRKANKWLLRLGKKRSPIADVYYRDGVAGYFEPRANDPLYHAETEAIRAMLEDVPYGASILQVPFGTGRFVPLYLENGMAISGLDTSAEMLEAAKAALGRQFTSCHVTVGDPAAMTFADGSFHALASVRFLSSTTLGQAKQALREFARVTRKQAIFSIDEQKDGSSRRRMPADEDAIGGRLYAPEIDELLRTSGFKAARKLGPMTEEKDRAVYMYLCERVGSA
jgi:ubiquinone/menaquinone biosynthesis C-methylase UbiE